MARTALPVTNISLAGVTWPAADGTAGDTVNGNEVTNGPRLRILVKNTHATVAQTATFITQGTAGGFAISDKAENLAVGAHKVYGPFPEALFGKKIQIDSTDAALKYICFQ